jgi:hypothetical protein
MAVVRHFSLNLIRNQPDKMSIKRRRKRTARDNRYLLQTRTPYRVNLDSDDDEVVVD